MGVLVFSGFSHLPLHVEGVTVGDSHLTILAESQQVALGEIPLLVLEVNNNAGPSVLPHCRPPCQTFLPLNPIQHLK